MRDCNVVAAIISIINQVFAAVFYVIPADIRIKGIQDRQAAALVNTPGVLHIRTASCGVSKDQALLLLVICIIKSAALTLIRSSIKALVKIYEYVCIAVILAGIIKATIGRRFYIIHIVVILVIRVCPITPITNYRFGTNIICAISHKGTITIFIGGNIACGIHIMNRNSALIICLTNHARYIIITCTITNPKGAQCAQIISIGQGHVLFRGASFILLAGIHAANNAAHITGKVVGNIIDCDIARVENVFNIAIIPIACNAAGYSTGIVNFAHIIGLFDNTAQAADDAAHVAAIIAIIAAADQPLIINVIQNDAGSAGFGAVTHNAANIDRGSAAIANTRGVYVAKVVAAGNAGIINKAANTAHVGITADVAHVIAVTDAGSTFTALNLCQAVRQCSSSIHQITSVNLACNAAHVGSLGRKGNMAAFPGAGVQAQAIGIRMDITAVARTANGGLDAADVAHHAANVACDIGLLITIISTAIVAARYLKGKISWLGIASAIYIRHHLADNSTCTHNVAAVIYGLGNAVINAVCCCLISSAKAAHDAAHVVRAVHLGLQISHIGKVAVLRAANNATHVAGNIALISRIYFCIPSTILTIFLHIGDNVTLVGGVLDIAGILAALTACNAAGNAAHVADAYKHSPCAVCRIVVFCIIRMEGVIAQVVACACDMALVLHIRDFAVLGKANNAAHVKAALNIRTVNQRCTAADSGATNAAHQAANTVRKLTAVNITLVFVIISIFHFAVIISRCGNIIESHYLAKVVRAADVFRAQAAAI